ncbi:MAG: protein-methionine-sulfoxide reductase catalytic subunit MsrP, partial [bacterium]
MKRYWEDPKLTPTPEEVFLNRRTFIRRLALGTVGAYALVTGCGRTGAQSALAKPGGKGPVIYPP